MPDAMTARRLEGVQLTSDGRLFVLLEVVVYKAEDER